MFIMLEIIYYIGKFHMLKYKKNEIFLTLIVDPASYFIWLVLLTCARSLFGQLPESAYILLTKKITFNKLYLKTVL
jgi:hypothetical protein